MTECSLLMSDATKAVVQVQLSSLTPVAVIRVLALIARPCRLSITSMA